MRAVGAVHIMPCVCATGRPGQEACIHCVVACVRVFCMCMCALRVSLCCKGLHACHTCLHVRRLVHTLCAHVFKAGKIKPHVQQNLNLNLCMERVQATNTRTCI